MSCCALRHKYVHFCWTQLQSKATVSELDAVKGKRVTAPCVKVRAVGVGLASRGWLSKWEGGGI